MIQVANQVEQYAYFTAGSAVANSTKADDDETKSDDREGGGRDERVHVNDVFNAWSTRNITDERRCDAVAR